MRAALVPLVFALGCDTDFERMIHQPRYRAYQATPAFEDGMVMRTPPPGAIARSRSAGPPLVQTGKDEHGDAQRIPVTVTRELVLRGQDRFAVFCTPCHGPLGDGKSEVARRMTLRPPPSLLDPRIRGMAPGTIFRTIGEGYGLMRSYAAQLPPSDRWAVVAYLRALQLSQGVKLSELPPETREEAKRWLQ
jgi:hypothetical protein